MTKIVTKKYNDFRQVSKIVMLIITVLKKVGQNIAKCGEEGEAMKFTKKSPDRPGRWLWKDERDPSGRISHGIILVVVFERKGAPELYTSISRYDPVFPVSHFTESGWWSDRPVGELEFE